MRNFSDMPMVNNLDRSIWFPYASEPPYFDSNERLCIEKYCLKSLEKMKGNSRMIRKSPLSPLEFIYLKSI